MPTNARTDARPAHLDAVVSRGLAEQLTMKIALRCVAGATFDHASLVAALDEEAAGLFVAVTGGLVGHASQSSAHAARLTRRRA